MNSGELEALEPRVGALEGTGIWLEVPSQSRVPIWRRPVRSMRVAGRRNVVRYFPTCEAARKADHSDPVPTIVHCGAAEIDVSISDRSGTMQDEVVSILRMASLIECSSKAESRNVARLGVPESKIRLIRPGVDTGRFIPRNGPAPEAGGPLRIVTVGRLEWRKGHEYALVAFRKLLERGVEARLDIVGEGPDRERVLFAMDDLGLSERTRLLPPRTPSDLAALFRGCDVYLDASVSEGIPDPLLQAMACGLPVVASSVGGIPEVVSHGSTGYLVAPRSTLETSNALFVLASDAATRLSFAVAARDKISAEFSMDRFQNDFRKMCREALADRAGR